MKEDGIEIPKISRKILKQIRFPRHHKNCYEIIVGGFRRNLDDFSGIRKVWVCDEKCEIKKKEKEMQK